MAAPVLGILAGAAARMAVGAAGRMALGASARAVGPAASRLIGSTGRTVGRVARSSGGRVFERRAKMTRRERKRQIVVRRAAKFARRFSNAAGPRRNYGGSGSGFFNQMPQQGNIAFSSVGSGQIDPNQAKQSIGTFVSMLSLASAGLGVFGTAVGSAVTGVRALQGFASVLLDSQRITARYSGSMSAAAAGLEVGRIGREMNQANATAGSFGKLSQSLDKLERAMQPFRESFTNALNTVISTALDFITPLVNAAKPLAKQMEGVAEMGRQAFALFIARGDKDEAEAFLKAMDIIERRNERKRTEKAQQSFNDLIQLRLNLAAVNAVNKPAPGIPANPIKGAPRERKARNPIKMTVDIPTSGNTGN